MRNVSATSFSSSDEDPPRVARLPSGLKTRLSLLRKSEQKRQQQLDPTRLSPLSARPPCETRTGAIAGTRLEYEHHPKPMRHHEVDPYKGQVAFYKDSISMSPQGRREREKRREADAKPCCCGLFEVGTVNTAAAWIGSWLTGVGTIMLYGLAASGKCFGGCLH
ncbi:uncharacterized protein PG986_012690 [Apiospora aurea]|uniref:Uncharacterized protein n=1 Tax=Apiospora aurea TaxID=335848 RepID=A0ABR1Q0Q0_9PEZI